MAVNHPSSASRRQQTLQQQHCVEIMITLISKKLAVSWTGCPRLEASPLCEAPPFRLGAAAAFFAF